MAGASVQIEFDDTQVQAVLQRLIEAGVDMTKVFTSIGNYLEGSHGERWDDQVAPDGTPWAPLTGVTRKLKRKNKEKILVLDALLQGSLAFNADADGLEFGTVSAYAAIHQFGGTTGAGSWIPGKEIPARPFLGISDDDEVEILEILQDYLSEAIAS